MSKTEQVARVATAAVLIVSSIVLAAIGDAAPLVVIPILGALVIVRRIP